MCQILDSMDSLNDLASDEPIFGKILGYYEMACPF